MQVDLHQARRFALIELSRYRLTPQEREDLVQDAVINVWRFQHTYDPSRKLSTWVMRIARNQMLDYLRSPKGVRDEELLDYAAPGLNQQDRLMEREERRRWVLAVRSLSRRQKRVIWMYALGLSYERMAERMGTTVRGIKSIKFRALDNMRRLLSS